MAVLTAEVRQRIIELHEEGLGCSAIARKLRINKGHVSLVLRGVGPNHKRTLSNAAVVATTDVPLALAAARLRLQLKKSSPVEAAAIEETSQPIEAAIAPTPPPVPPVVIPKFVPLPGVTVSPRRVVVNLGWDERDTPRVSLFQHEHEGGPVCDGYGGRKRKAYIP